MNIKETFKRFVSNDHLKPQVEVIERTEKPFEGLSMEQIIEQIHEDFYMEVDKLLEFAQIRKSTSTEKQGLLHKQERLEKFGFVGTAQAKEAKEEIERIEKAKQENWQKQNLKETIEYFSFKYPNYKFITEESVKRICAKYNLIYGNVSLYRGFVPDKNLKDIENFKIQEEDCLFMATTYWYSLGGIKDREEVDFVSYKKAQNKKEYEKYMKEHLPELSIRSRTYSETISKAPLEIAAPQKDFDMSGMEVKNFQISKIKVEIPDPIVLHPVYYKGIKHYLIVTAWGLEASDELVVNETLN